MDTREVGGLMRLLNIQFGRSIVLGHSGMNVMTILSVMLIRQF